MKREARFSLKMVFTEDLLSYCKKVKNNNKVSLLNSESLFAVSATIYS